MVEGADIVTINHRPHTLVVVEAVVPLHHLDQEALIRLQYRIGLVAHQLLPHHRRIHLRTVILLTRVRLIHYININQLQHVHTFILPNIQILIAGCVY